MDIFDWILLGTLSGAFLIHFGYLLALKAFNSLSHRGQHASEEEQSLPDLSIIVATYNESMAIRAKLESLNNLSYPREKYKVIVVDSGSTDGTSSIVKEYRRRGVILLEQEKRMGKASAINYALSKTCSDIIVLTDANAEFGSEALSALVQKFDRNTGAVSPRFMPIGRLSYWDKVFYWLHHVYHSLESGADSVFLVHGELFAFRRELIDRIEEDTAADDLEIALAIRKKGYRVRYASDICAKEKVPSKQREVRIQRSRRIFGIIQAMVRNLRFFLNPRYGLYGLLIFPAHFLQITVGPLLVFSSLVLLAGKLCVLVFQNIEILGPSILFASLVLFILLSRIGVRDRVISLGYNFLATEAYMTISLVNLLRRKKFNVWEKIPSTREYAGS